MHTEMIHSSRLVFSVLKSTVLFTMIIIFCLLFRRSQACIALKQFVIIMKICVAVDICKVRLE